MEGMFTLSIKKPGKTTRGNSGINKYEACLPCADKIQTQCASLTKRLPENWGFSNMPSRIEERPSIVTPAASHEEVLDAKIAEKESELSDRPQKIDNIRVKAGNEECNHYNKTSPKWGRITDDYGEVVEAMYHKCVDCDATVKYQTVKERNEYLGGDPSGDFNVSTHESEDRKR